MGQYENECPTKNSSQSSSQGSETATIVIQEEMVLVSFQKSSEETGRPSPAICLAGSVASGHMINDDDGILT